MKIRLLLIVVALIAFSGAASEVAAQSKETASVREAKITMAQARAAAMERGGKLLYEFEIHNANKRETEVHHRQ